MKFSDDAKLIAAVLQDAAHPDDTYQEIWERVDALIAAAPAGDAAQTAEPTEEEWAQAVIEGAKQGNFDTTSDYCRYISEEAHRLAALRANTPGPRGREGESMKTIVVQWVPEEGLYGRAMRVIASDHPRFSKGARFDFGFFSIATDEGYTIVSLPMVTP